MNQSMIVVFSLCTLACGHAIFWALVLLRINDRLSNRLLAGLLLMLAIRVGKSVTGFVFPGHMELFATIGLLGMAEVGPFFLLLIYSLFDSSFRLRRIHILHFLPGVVSVVFAAFGYWIVYRIFTLQLFVYLIFCAAWLLSNRSSLRPEDVKWKWSWFLFSGILVLWITFVLQITFYQPMVYEAIVISAAVIFYGLSWWAIDKAQLFLPVRKKKQNDTIDLHREVGRRIEQLFDEQQLYIDTGMNVTRLASHLKVPPYVVSRAVNSYFGKTFSELLTSYRIRKSESILKTDVGNKFTIEAVAFESGFSTITSFYSAFKRQHKMTPSQYRDRISGNSGIQIG